MKVQTVNGMQHAVNTIANAHKTTGRTHVNIRGLPLDGIGKQGIHQAHHRVTNRLTRIGGLQCQTF